MLPRTVRFYLPLKLLNSVIFLDGIGPSTGGDMKRILIAASVLAFHFSAMAEETHVKAPVPEGFEAMKMEGMPAEVSKNSKVKFSTSCTDITGRSIKQGEVGYETCMSDVKLKNLNPNKVDKSNSSTTGPQMNMDFKVND